MLHAEDLLDNAIAHLRADLPSKIDAINTAIGDDIILTAPADTGGDTADPEVSYSTGGDPILRQPWVEVAVPDFTLTELDLGQVSALFAANVAVLGFILEPRPPIERADRHVKRFGQALADCLMQPDAFGVGVSVESVRGSYRIDPEAEGKEGPVAVVTNVYTVVTEVVRTVT